MDHKFQWKSFKIPILMLDYYVPVVDQDYGVSFVRSMKNFNHCMGRTRRFLNSSCKSDLRFISKVFQFFGRPHLNVSLHSS